MYFLATKLITVQLKSIEIKGFKSFADKTHIHFNNQITGIVGPNGCGKSNVVDSIRWVLGEQKTSNLRLEKMDNLIFNGTQKRTQAGRAEVSLTFENTKNILPTEFNTVTVTRLLYRSGDSEYKLNDVPCRLKDITNLFLDTGVGTDSYAIIELGMIDDILKDKENSRRKLFEQAAGISKYKNRKKETLQKLNATDGDLSRVEDLLFEIENNLKTLEKQAKRAEKYYKIKDQYKEISIKLAILHLAQYKNLFSTLQQQQQNEETKKIELETAIAKIEAKTAQKKLDLIEREKKLNHLQKQTNEKTLQIREEENNKNLLTQSVNFLKERKQNLETQNKQNTQLLLNLQEECDLLQHNKTDEEKSLQTFNLQVNTSKELLDKLRIEYQQQKTLVENKNTELRKLENSIVDIEKKIAVSQSQKEGFIKNSLDYEKQKQTQLFDLTSLENELTIFETEKNKLETELTYLQSNYSEIKQIIITLEQSISEEQKQLLNKQREFDAYSNEYKLTKSLVDSLEGFPDSVKFLKTNNSWNNSSPLLLDIINCDEEYKVAIENYLKPYLNYFIVNNFEEALIALSMLDKQNKGKANFFILDQIAKINPLPNNHQNGVAALDIVNVANEYTNLIHSLLHQVYIINNIPDINKYNNLKHTSLVSKDGKIVVENNSISGGSVGAYEGKRIGKRQHLEKLSRLINELQTQINNHKININSIQQQIQNNKNELKQKEQTLQLKQQQFNSNENKWVSAKAKIENTQKFMTESQQKTSLIQTQLNALASQIQEASNLLSLQTQQKNQQKEELANIESIYKNTGIRLSKSNQEFSDLNIEFVKQQNRVQTLHSNLDFKKKQLNDTQNQLYTGNEQLNSAQNELIVKQNALEEVTEFLMELYGEKKIIDKLLIDAENNYFTMRGDVDAEEIELRSNQKNKEQVDFILQSIHEKINEIKFKLISMKERLQIEFKTNLDDMFDNNDEILETKEELEDKNNKIKKQLDAYGEINPMAIEEYTIVKERYDFILTQRNDLLESKKLLLETIGEIEGKATEQFMTTFNQARENFVKVFRSLFTPDDHCDITLLEPENVLESAIDIIAKPKGKRPQSINQLSGGEKSLTALALLFALYLLKPAPFCILDEVDAPLDDTNVGKFTQIIREFSNQSQFIIVTHNKNTMASVDVIYGVTMIEQGVSKVVPVDFRTLNNN